MQSGFLLDTNIISLYTRRHLPPDAIVDWMSNSLQPFYISAINYYEIIAGLLAINATKTIREFKSFLDQTDIKQLSITSEIIEQAAIFYAKSKLLGKRQTTADAIIAASAIVHDLILVTHDKDFFGFEVTILDPFKK